MLKLENVETGEGGFALRADLQIAPGCRAAVIGPSGAGKSTLLEAIAGFRALRSGRVIWQGGDLTGLPPGRRPVAMLFQDGNLFPHLSVAQNVLLGLRPNGRARPEDHEQVAQALGRVGLEGMGARKPAQLSGGQQSRVALARVLVQRRDILLLDEPFAALGPALKTGMLDLVADLMRETQTTLLMVSHDPEDARRICDQTILVTEGQAQVPVATAALLANPTQALRDYLG